MPEGRVIAVCTSSRRGIPKRWVETAELLAGRGIEGDAHAGSGHRQVSLLDLGDIDAMRARGLELAPGAFGENLVITGLDTRTLGIGSRLGVGGEAVLEISQIGKVCHKPCAIYLRTGDCIMPRHGLFASVVAGGRVEPGDGVRVLHHVAKEQLQAAVVGEGRTAALVARHLESERDAHLAWYGALPDGGGEVAAQLAELSGRGLDLVVAVEATATAAVAALPVVSAGTASGPEIDVVGARVCSGAIMASVPRHATRETLRELFDDLLSAWVRLRAAGVRAGGGRLPDDEGTTTDLPSASFDGVGERAGERA